jgi:apolipoprotein N-acyltransferase
MRTTDAQSRFLQGICVLIFHVVHLCYRPLKMNYFNKFSLPILTGILIGTSFIPFPPWASFFAFVPLWIFLLKQDSAKKVFWGAWISSFILTLIGFNWIAHTVREFGHMPWSVSIGALIAFCGFANLDVPLAALAWFWLKKPLKLEGFQSLTLLALLTALSERYFPTIFTWNYGFTFYWVDLPMAQVAELIGFQGLSALVILANLLAYYAWTLRESKLGRKAAASLIGVFLFLNAAGWAIQKTLTPPDKTLRALVVQANIGNLEKQYAEKGAGFRDHIVQKFIAMTKAALADTHADFGIWPETAFPVTVYGPEAYDPYVSYVKTMVQEMKTPMVIGGYGEDPEQKKSTNSIYLIDENGNFQWPGYNKTHLLAFGEYLPFGDYFPKLRDALPVGDFARGGGPSAKDFIIRDHDLKIGPQICYEGLFPMFSKQLADQGANVIINVTNDSWFGDWMEPHQHLYMTLGRAIEFRRPVIRSTNTGISTVALADGTILEKSPLNVEWTHIFTVPYSSAPTPTLYQKFPWLMDVLLIILTLWNSCAILIGKKSKNGSLNSPPAN